MRLLVVTPWPLASPGGGQRLVTEIAAALTAHYQVDVVVAAGSGLQPATPGVQVATRDGEWRLPLVRQPEGLWHFARRDTASLRLDGLDEVAQRVRPDAILYVPHYSACARQARALASSLDVPFLLWPAIHLDARAQTGRAAAAFYRSAVLVCCLSDAEREWLVRKAGVRPERAVTVGYGWNGPVLPWTPRSLDGRELQLLTVAAYVPHKQVDHQIRAVALLRDAFGVTARLTVAGALLDPGVLERLRREVRRHHLDGAVDFRVNCTDGEIAALYDRADFFLFTSRSESFGIAVLEAIAAATAPVVYPHPVYRGWIESSGVGYVAAASSPRALAEALLQARSTSESGADDRRVAWLASRSWRRVVAPLADALTHSKLAPR